MAQARVTEASRDFGAMIAEDLGKDVPHVPAPMRDPATYDGARVARIADLVAGGRHFEAPDRAASSSGAAAPHAGASTGGRDVVIHAAGRMDVGPAGATWPEPLAHLPDANLPGTQQVNGAVLPGKRAAKTGPAIGIGSGVTRYGTPPVLGPSVAAKPATDALTEGDALVLSRVGIRTSIVAPGAFNSGTRASDGAGAPDDAEGSEAWWSGAYATVRKAAFDGLAAPEPRDADPALPILPWRFRLAHAALAARRVPRVGAMAKGSRPSRTHLDPPQDGAAIVTGVGDRVRAQRPERIGLADLHHPHP